jgi:hypothetical protein
MAEPGPPSVHETAMTVNKITLSKIAAPLPPLPSLNLLQILSIILIL